MKIEVDSKALNKLEAMVQQLQEDRDMLRVALIDCVAVMSRKLDGLKCIQPELRYAREAIAKGEKHAN